MSRQVKGVSSLPAEASGELLFSDEPLSFWGGYDAESGEIIDRRHELQGCVAAGKVLAIPATRGSSTTTAVILEAIRNGTAPAAFLTRENDAFLALAAIVANELYGTAPPIVTLGAASFGALVHAKRARIDRSGVVAFD